MRPVATMLISLLLPITLFAREQPTPPAVPAAELVFREVRYDGKLSDTEARFAVDIDAEATGRSEAAAPLFEGDVAVFASKLPTALRLVRDGSQYRLIASKAGRYKFRVDVVAKITRAEPWNQISFNGPTASIASVGAQAAGPGIELQLLAGTLLESEQKGADAHIRGFLGEDRTVSLRWQSKATELTRKAMVTSETTATVQITPTVIKFSTQLRYEIVQGNLPRLSVEIPASQSLTRVDGAQIRDWQVKSEGDHQVLTIEFIKPVEKSYNLALQSEQSVETASLAVQLTAPKPLEVTRESGGITVSSEDTLVEIESTTGLRQINAVGGALASYQFYGRPFVLGLKLQRIQPVLNVANRITVRLEETRLLATHAVTLAVEKAGLYAIELAPLHDFTVADVRGDGVEDWKVADGKLQVSFGSRVLGTRNLQVQLERPLKTFPEQVVVEPLRVTGAAKETAQIGAVAAAGLQVKTAELVGLREVPITSLTARTDELLAYQADQPGWKLSLATERLAPRVLADIFNLVTVGDGLVGGSATIRYAIINQGVQEFRVTLPAQCKNVEFTGPNIRRKEQQGDTWTIGLQDKAWGAYTLVVTYDYQFDPHNATLPAAGIHALDVERETGSVAITSAASLQFREKTAKEPLRRIDESELADNDRALITRPVLLAYRYEGSAYELAVDVTRFEELPVLQAVADHTQLTTVVTDAGEMLTQASFMVKNNAKQFQTFTLPAGADFWACYVGGQAVKAERDDNKVLVPLPRGANRDQAVAVEIVYAQKMGTLKTLLPRSLALVAPQTDIQTTYAEWEVFVPETHRLASFGGNMTVAQGTTYGLHDAWVGFERFYDYLYQSMQGTLVGFIILGGILWFVIMAVRHGWRGLLTVLTVVAIIGILAAMLLPALNQARDKARRANEMSNLRQIGLGMAMFADAHQGQLPNSLDDMLGSVITSDRVFIDPNTGQRLVYLGAGRKWQSEGPDLVLAHSPNDHNGSGRNVLFTDGHVAFMSEAEFNGVVQRTMAQVANEPRPSFGSDGKAMGVASEESATDRLAPAASPAPAGMAGAPPPATVTAILGGGGGSVNGAPNPAVAGIKPIRIEIPKTGLRFVFTKVLNVRDEPLSARALVMTGGVRNGIRSALELGALLIGLGLLWWQRQSAKPKSLVVTIGLALVLSSITHMLIAWRLLHVALILVPPALVLAIIVWLVRRYWTAKAENGLAGTLPASGGVPPAVALIALMFLPLLTRADDVSVLSATYTGAVHERIAQVDAVIQVNAAEANQRVKLFGGDVAVQQFTATPSEVKLVRDGSTVAALLPRRGTATLRVKFLVKLGGDVAKRQLVFGIPSALSSQFVVTIDETEAAVEVPTAVSFKTAADKQQTRVEAVMGAGDRLELRWTPRVKRAEEIAATVLCQNATLVSFAHGVMSTRAILDYQVTQGELRQMRVRVPADQRVLRVQGELIRTWEMKSDPGEQVLVVELLKGVSPNYRLTVETEKVIDALPASVRVETAHALDVKRETGLVALAGSEELGLTVETSQEAQRVDVEEFARTIGVQPSAPPSFKPANFPPIARECHDLPPTVNGRIFGTVVAGRKYFYEASGAVARNLEKSFYDDPDGNEYADSSLSRRVGNAEAATLPQFLCPGLNRFSLVGKIDGNTCFQLGARGSFIAAATGRLALYFNDDIYEDNSGTWRVCIWAVNEGADTVASTETGATPSRFDAAGIITAYRFLKPEFDLRVRVETLQSQIEAVVRNHMLIGTEQLNLTARINYTIKRAGVFTLRVALPPDYRVERVIGQNVSQWIEKGSGVERVLEVALKERTMGSYELQLGLAKLLKELPQKVEVAGVHPLDIQKLTGFVTVSSEAGVATKAVSFEGLTEIPASDAAGIQGELSTRSLRIRANIDGNDYVHIRGSQVWYIHGGWGLPGNSTYVNGEEWTPHWDTNHPGTSSSRFTGLTPALPTSGQVGVALKVINGRGPVKLEQAPSANNDYEAIVWLNDDTFNGSDWYEFTLDWTSETAQAPNITTQRMNETGATLAYKFVSTEATAQRAWKLDVTTEAVDPWLRAEVVNWMTVGETLVSARTVVRYDIQNAPVKELRLRVPSAFKNVEVQGENIRRRDQNGETWQVELQNKMRGTYTLTVTWERPWDPKHGDFDFAGVEAVGVERETGALAVIAHPPLQVNEKTASGDLIRIDARELPDWVGRADEATVLAYRYLRPGYKLALTGRRFDEAEVLQALVDNVRLTTVVAEDGQMMTEAAFAVRNNGRQYLEVTLPQGAEVWSAFVAGGAVRPSVREGRLLLPLERAGADEAAIPVQVTYVSSQKFPARSGRITLESPAVDVPLKNAQWELYLPTDYDYRGFTGTMMHEIGGAPVQQVFTLSDYTRDEQVRKAEAEVQSLGFLSVARRKLSGGNVKEALSYYNSAVQNRNETPQSGQPEYRQLELDLRRAQASNVAQGGNVLLKDGHVGWKSSLPQQATGLGDIPAQSTSQPVAQFDEETAAKQWDKLQQAQELTVAKVLPLRVNLPTHGVRHVFTQVLQTEVKVPMNVSFEASNTGSTSWPVRVSLSVVGFAALWLLVAGALAWRRS